MFERYTEKARRAVFFARYEASMFGAEAIEPEHLLLGVARESKAWLNRLLPAEMARTDALRREVEGRSPVKEKVDTNVNLPLSEATKRAMWAASEEADRLNQSHIGTEHLLLGLLTLERSVAASIFREQGVDLTKGREIVQSLEETESADAVKIEAEGSALIAEIRSHGHRLLSLADRLRTEAEASIKTKGRKATVPVRGGRRVVLGLEKLLGDESAILRGARVGLISNQSSVDHSLRHAADLFQEKGINLTTLFGPQHGIRGDVQDNMVETGHAVDRATGIPIFSLYSETREPTEEMLKNVDVLVFDMQDVGCRIYTFIYTLANCMRAAKLYGKRVLVCDRPNPITGSIVAGNVLETEWASFVGQYPIPTRHGMTVGEIARLFNEHFGIGCELEIVSMEGWSREQWMDEGDAPWVMPSPNMPTLETATVFPGTVHLEGTQISEGRGTTRPFELVGAPYIEAEVFARHLNAMGLVRRIFQGLRFSAYVSKTRREDLRRRADTRDRQGSF